MTPNTYDVGDLVTLTGRFYSDEAQTTPASPTTVVLSVRDPLGVVATPVVTPGATGVFTAPFLCEEGGMHQGRWEGTGAVQAAEQFEFFVRRVNTA